MPEGFVRGVTVSFSWDVEDKWLVVNTKGPEPLTQLERELKAELSKRK